MFANFYSVYDIAHAEIGQFYPVYAPCMTVCTIKNTVSDIVHSMFLTVHNLFLTACEVCAWFIAVVKNCAHGINYVTCNRLVTAKHEQNQSGYRLRYKLGKRIYMCAYVCVCAPARACARTCIIIIIIYCNFYLFIRAKPHQY